MPKTMIQTTYFYSDNDLNPDNAQPILNHIYRTLIL